MSRRRAVRILLLCVVGALPWTIIRWTGSAGVQYGAFFAYGLGPLSGPLGERFMLLPRYLAVAVVDTYWRQAWPTGAFLFACALGSAALALVGREDRRVTAGLLVMSGGAELLYAVGLAGSRSDLLVLPVAPLLCWGVALLCYRDGLRRLVYLRPAEA
ncbi:hypothetical protein [Halarchaeum nitratireducens]|uniref:DUF8050 domain-containing protein n=1 Tax=Halarchaeum nitratireducens TaxID=489913 RepID=A0A830GDN5_9EURY|nr:hypothetical protein [Halarchaeum nitratireducens]GGN22557.1 hypothetical protein GCM10009021_25120 [Halarchaeum nitratireducens]